MTVPTAVAADEGSRLGGAGPRIIDAVVVVAALTFASNILGFLREVVIARGFGASGLTDSFFAGQAIVGLGFLVFSSGAIQASLMPRYQSLRGAGEDERAAALIRCSLSLLLPVVGFAAWGMFTAAPWIVGVALSRFDADRASLAVAHIRVMSPLIVLVSVGALLQSVLNAHRQFWQAALVPVLSSIVVIGLVVVVGPWLGIMSLSWGFLLGGSLWCLFLAPFAWRWLSRPAAGDIAPVIRGVLISFGSMAVLTLVDQLVAVFQRSLIADHEVGVISALSYAGRLAGFPIGLVGAALATVMLPVLADANERGRATIEDVFETGLLALLAVMLPIACLLVSLALPTVVVVFQRGAFDDLAARNTAAALAWYSAGLPVQAAMVLLWRLYFAVQRPALPLKIGLVAAVAWFALSWICVREFGWIGVAIATLVYAYLHVALLIGFLGAAVSMRLGRLLFLILRLIAALPALAVGLQLPLPDSFVGLVLKVVVALLAYHAALWGLRERSMFRLVRMRWP